MKSTTLATTLATLLSTAALVQSATIARRNEIAHPRAVCAGPGRKVADPPGAAPRRVELPASDPSLKKVKVRYGPYVVPNMMRKSVIGENGSLWNCGDDNIEKPCEECTIVSLTAGLEYPNGTNANIDTGMWMHHMVALTTGPNRWDPTCYGNEDSLPHVLVGLTPNNSERLFAAGNERVTMDMRNTRIRDQPVGYHLGRDDQLRFIVDMMNMNMADVTAYLTMTYEVRPGALPAGWQNVKPVWLDVDQCGVSEVEAPEGKSSFTISSVPWTPNVEGDVVTLFGHLHDGGQALRINALGDKGLVCDSKAKYAESPEYIFKTIGVMENGDQVAERHVSSMSVCEHASITPNRMTKDQSWVVHAEYDYSKNAGNMAEGKPQDIMGIGFILIEAPPDGHPPPKQ